MIVDLHTHLWDSPDQLGPSASQWIRANSEEPWLRPEPSIPDFAEAMKPVTYAAILGCQSQALQIDVNLESVARYVANDPAKYLGFAGIDPLIPDSSDNIDKAIELGMVGLTINPAACHCHPTHTRALNIYEKAASKKWPVIFQTANHFGAQAALEFDQPILLDEVARDFPDLKIVIAQLGFPFVDQTLTILQKHENVYADLSNLTDKPWQLYHTLLKAYEQHVTDHLLLGSDYPFFTPQKAILAIYSINTLAQTAQLPSVPREMLRAVVERNTLTCLDITPPKAKTETEQNTTSLPEPSDSEFPTIVINDQEN